LLATNILRASAAAAASAAEWAVDGGFAAVLFGLQTVPFRSKQVPPQQPPPQIHPPHHHTMRPQLAAADLHRYTFQ
jgi:hypothetical protein